MPGQRELQEFKELRVRPESLVLKAISELQEILAPPVQPDYPEPQDPKATQALLVYREILVPKDLQEQQALKVMPELQEA